MRDRLSGWYKTTFTNVDYYAKAMWAGTEFAGNKLYGGVQSYVNASPLLKSATTLNLTQLQAYAAQYGEIVWEDTKVTGSMLYNGACRIQSYLTSTPWVQTAAKNTTKQVIKGASRAFDPEHAIEIIDRPHTARALWNGITANLWYLTAAVSYYWAIKGVVHKVGLQGGYVEATLDCAAFTYLFMQFSAKMFVENTFYNMTVAKVSAMEETTALELEKKTEHFKACECGAGKQAKGMLGSPFYLLADQAYIWVVSHSISKILGLGMPHMIADTVGYSTKLFLERLRYGQVILEYKLAAKGMCTQHRYALLTQNNRYAFGMGAAYFLECWLFAAALKYCFSVGNGFTDDAINSSVFLYYIFVAQTIRDPLPDTNPGIDFFKYCRRATSAVLSHTTNQLTALASYVTRPDIKKWLDKEMETLAKFPPFKRVGSLSAFNSELVTLENRIDALCRIDAARLYFEYGISDFQEIINEIKLKRNSRAHQLVNNTFLYYFFSTDSQKLLDILFDNRLPAVLDRIESVLKRIERESKTSVNINQTLFNKAVNTLRSKLGLGELQQKQLTLFVQEDYDESYRQLTSIGRISVVAPPLTDYPPPALYVPDVKLPLPTKVNPSVVPSDTLNPVPISIPTEKPIVDLSLATTEVQHTKKSLLAIPSSSQQIIQALDVKPTYPAQPKVVTSAVEKLPVISVIPFYMQPPKKQVEDNKKLFVKPTKSAF